MNVGGLVVLVHVLAAFALVSGLVGRTIVIAQASRGSDIRTTTELMVLAGRFERIVIPSSLVLILAGFGAAILRGWPLLGGDGAWWLPISIVLTLSFIPLVYFLFLPRGRIFQAALDEAQAQGRITSALSAAFADRAVLFARRYEAVAVTVVLVLMLTKPF